MKGLIWGEKSVFEIVKDLKEFCNGAVLFIRKEYKIGKEGDLEDNDIQELNFMEYLIRFGLNGCEVYSVFDVISV